jgi:hypothetical protein
MTATINPGEYIGDLKRNDARIRLSEYRRGLRFWTTFDDTRLKGVVLCENSGADIDAFADLVSKSPRPVEVLGFDGNKKPPMVHYGYSELGIIDNVFRESRLLGNCAYFMKATGRLTFPRISDLLDTIWSEFDAVVDHRRKYRHETGYYLRARTQLMLFSREFYLAHFLDRRDEMIGRYSHIEEFVAEKLGELPKSTRIIKRFKVECQPHGFSAFDNKSYQSFETRCKNYVRALARRMFPALWI